MLLALAIVGVFVLPEPWGLVLLPIAALIEIAEVYFWIHFLRRYRVTTGAEGLIGERATVIERCAPEGLVRVRGEIWRARCETAADPGDSTRIAAVDGLTLVVEPARGDSSAGAGGQVARPLSGEDPLELAEGDVDVEDVKAPGVVGRGVEPLGRRRSAARRGSWRRRRDVQRPV